MNAEVLGTRQDGNSTCYLARMSLFEYVENIPDDYKDYDVQREIVSNVYLDNLVETVLLKKHIPPIVLIANGTNIIDNILEIPNFKILDGLQRTYRLNVIWKTISFFIQEFHDTPGLLGFTKFALSRKYSKALSFIESSTRVLSVIIELYQERFSHLDDPNQALIDCYKKNYQWFEIWINLTPKEEVDKMLILNAGHKPVKIKHQLEIIFSNILPLLKEVDRGSFRIIREKQIASTQFSKNRKKGEFHFSHLISALISFKEGIPVTTNSALIQKLQDSDFKSEEDSQYFSFEFLENYVGSLIEIETAIIDSNTNSNDAAVKWIGREIALTGIYGAFGAKLKSDLEKDLLIGFLRVKATFIRNIGLLNLSGFETARNNLDLGKINIGTVNKNAVFNATKHLLSSPNPTLINWNFYFNN